MSFFFVLANLSVTGLSVSYYLFLYTATSDPDTLFSIQIHGLAGYIAGRFKICSSFFVNGVVIENFIKCAISFSAMTVAVRQVMPDNVILRTPLGKLTNR